MRAPVAVQACEWPVLLPKSISLNRARQKICAPDDNHVTMAPWRLPPTTLLMAISACGLPPVKDQGPGDANLPGRQWKAARPSSIFT